MAVRLSGPDSGPGAAGHWTDFAAGEHGDLLDVIARTCRLHAFRDVLDEARRFLSLPQPERRTAAPKSPPAPSGSPEAARRLFTSARPIPGTIAETYLRSRGIVGVGDLDCLRFHPHCYYRAHDGAPRDIWPALIAAVSDLDGTITGVLRTWLARDGSGKAPLATPRRALGRLLGHGVRFRRATEVMAAGEGLETMLSLRIILPDMPMMAALSAHLAALILPAGLRRLYIARDNDRGGHRAAQSLSSRASVDGIEALVLTPHADDFNTDLCGLGPEALAASLRVQLTPEDVARFLAVDQRPGPRPHQRAPAPGRPRGRPRPAFKLAMVPEAAEARNSCARLSSPGATPARLRRLVCRHS
ncbi:MAG: toprim domain-containing protein, partial [Hyphomicrobiaceae bacterium]